MVYVLNISDGETQMILNTMVNERFFGKSSKGYYLTEMGKFHAKKKIDSFKDSIKESKDDSQRWQIDFILGKRRKKVNQMMFLID